SDNTISRRSSCAMICLLTALVCRRCATLGQIAEKSNLAGHFLDPTLVLMAFVSRWFVLRMCRPFFFCLFGRHFGCVQCGLLAFFAISGLVFIEMAFLVFFPRATMARIVASNGYIHK